MNIDYRSSRVAGIAALLTCFIGTSALAQLRPHVATPNGAHGVALDADDGATDRAIGLDPTFGLTGACCVYGVCVPNVDASDCLGMCGTFEGEGTSCEGFCCAYTIDFESTPIAPKPALGCDVAIANGMPLEVFFLTPNVVVFSDPDGYHNGLAAFDSTPNVNADDEDLQSDQGNVLILQQKHYPQQDQDGNFVRPNDAAEGGLFGFFTNSIRPLSMDLLDICVNDGDGAWVILISDAGEDEQEGPLDFPERIYHVPAGWTSTGDGGVRTLDLTTLADQNGAGGTVATAEEDPGFDDHRVVFVIVELDGSGAVDNFEYCVPYAPDKCETE